MWAKLMYHNKVSGCFLFEKCKDESSNVLNIFISQCRSIENANAMRMQKRKLMFRFYQIEIPLCIKKKTRTAVKANQLQKSWARDVTTRHTFEFVINLFTVVSCQLRRRCISVFLSWWWKTRLLQGVFQRLAINYCRRLCIFTPDSLFIFAQEVNVSTLIFNQHAVLFHLSKPFDCISDDETVSLER